MNGRIYTQLLDRTVSPVRSTATSAAGRVSYAELDAKGRPTKLDLVNTHGFVPTLLSYYDGTEPGAIPAHAGLLASVTRSDGNTTRTYQLGYDVEGNLASVTDPLGRTMLRGYDAAARPVEVETPAGELLRFEYDPAGNMTLLAQPGSPTSYGADDVHTMAPDSMHRLGAYRPPVVSGLPQPETSYDFNEDHQLELVTHPDGSSLDPSYDATTGELTDVAIDPSPNASWLPWTLSMSYVSSGADIGKLSQLHSSLDGSQLDYSYSGQLLTAETTSGPIDGVVSFSYDDDLRIASEGVSAGGGHTITRVYADADGLLSQVGGLLLTRQADSGLLSATSIAVAGSSITDSYGYNAYVELETYSASHNGTTLYDISYSHDDAGRIVQKVETILGGPSLTTDYSYNLDGRLNLVKTNGNITEQYGYDANGNRISALGVSGTISHDTQDRMLSYDGVAYSYTDWGALVQKGSGPSATYYEYDLRGALRKVTLPNGDVLEYIIDGRGRRIGKKRNGTLERGWLYRDGLNPIAELNSSGNLDTVFVYGTRPHVPDYMVKGGYTYRLLTDHLGSVRLVVNVDTGAIAQKWDYDAWGNATFDASAVTETGGNETFQPFTFAGGLFDVDTALVRFGARDYDPEVGRWTAKDPIRFDGRQANLYEYVGSQPQGKLDPTGLEVQTCIGQAMSCALGGHMWIETDTESFGMGGGCLSTNVQNHTPLRGMFDDAQCYPIDDVDEACVNAKARYGEGLGTWFPVFNDCQQWAFETIDACRNPAPPPPPLASGAFWRQSQEMNNEGHGRSRDRQGDPLLL